VTGGASFIGREIKVGSELKEGIESIVRIR